MRYYLASALNEVWYIYVRFIVSRAFVMMAHFFWATKNKKISRSLCAASLRYGINSSNLLLYKKIIENYPYTKSDASHGVSISEVATRTIVVKWPAFKDQQIDKGILIITFTKTFSYFLRHINLESFGRFFHIVFEPSWSGYADPDIIGFVGRLDSVIVQSSEIEDRVLLSSFPKTFVPVGFGASDWVDSKLFHNRSLTKKYDSVYIANTNPVKRVRRYLEAIRRIVSSGRTDYVGCLVCASWGGAQELIAKLVDSYKLKENIVLKFSLSRDQVIECLNQSKVNILLSFKEGSNRSLFEAIFCDTPVICIRENVGVNKSYINEFTGLLIADVQLEDSLLWMKDHYEIYRPRDWAIQNIDPKITTNKLVSLINSRIPVLASGVEFSEVYVKTNNPEASYFEYPTVSHKKYSEGILKLFEARSDGDESGFADDVLVENLTQMRDRFIHDLQKANK